MVVVSFSSQLFAPIRPTLIHNKNKKKNKSIYYSTFFPCFVVFTLLIHDKNKNKKYFIFVGPRIITHCRQKWFQLLSAQKVVTKKVDSYLLIFEAIIQTLDSLRYVYRRSLVWYNSESHTTHCFAMNDQWSTYNQCVQDRLRMIFVRLIICRMKDEMSRFQRFSEETSDNFQAMINRSNKRLCSHFPERNCFIGITSLLLLPPAGQALLPQPPSSPCHLVSKKTSWLTVVILVQTTHWLSLIGTMGLQQIGSKIVLLRREEWIVVSIVTMMIATKFSIAL